MKTTTFPRRGALAALLVTATVGCNGGEPAPAPAPETAQDTAALAPSQLTVNLRAYSGHYLVADKGGGAALQAYSTWAKEWETFTLTDLNGGTLQSGDVVTLRGLGGQWVSADKGGGGAVYVNAPHALGWEEFRLVKVGGTGTIAAGDKVALQTTLGGQYLSAIDSGGGDVLATGVSAREWETLTLLVPGTTPPPSGTTPKQRVLNYIQGISGTKTIAGQHNREPNWEPAKWTNAINGTTGRWPGLWSGDFLFQQENIDSRGTMINEAKKQFAAGAVVQLMWHSCPPTQGEACAWQGGVVSKLSDSQWNELLTDGSNLNRVWKSRVDRLVPYLQDLKNNGVAALFRPYHEMNQGVFWWGGRTGAQGTRRLYQMTHDYLTKTKGIDNLIWVWDVQDLSWNFNDYNPGDAYWDIAALDFYNGDGFTKAKYDAMLAVAGNKPIAIGECDRLPGASELRNQPRWVFFMGWSELVYDRNSAAELKAVYGADNVLTRDELPGWK
ncbi:glycosyl hydrolase [Melittangium boletus]|uniref:glycosyl hydrolase n=1 Tax=Melittangium boletus TaxID=83453 RepID=UPI003DA57B0D